MGTVQRRLLSGTYECSLDNRFRMAIPARVRDPFAAGAMVGWWFDDCVIVVPREDWGSMIERTFGAMSLLDDEQRDLSRFLLAGAFDQDLDKQGRILLPAELRDHAGIGGRVEGGRGRRVPRDLGPGPPRGPLREPPPRGGVRPCQAPCRPSHVAR